MTPLQKDKQPNWKMGKGFEQTLFQGGHTKVPDIYGKMLTITSHQRDENWNRNEIPLHTGENGHHKQINKQQVLERMWRKENPSTLLVGMQTGAATVENSMGFLQKTKNGTAFWPGNSTTWIISPWKTNQKEPMHPNVHSITIYNSQVLEAP